MFFNLSRRRMAGGVLAGMTALPTAVRADGPFVSRKLVLQLSDSSVSKQALIISVSNNLLVLYGPDTIAIEVVCFAEGISLLRIENPRRAEVDALVQQGVVFDVCMNTVDTIERESGNHVALNPNAVRVQAGVATIIERAERGYVIVRP